MHGTTGRVTARRPSCRCDRVRIPVPPTPSEGPDRGERPAGGGQRLLVAGTLREPRSRLTKRLTYVHYTPARMRRKVAMKDIPLPEQSTRMPPPVAEVFASLNDLVTETHFRWLTYRELFAISQARVDLLNECAGHFFVVIHEILLTDVQLDLCKLTERARMRKQENLSLAQLQDRLDAYGEPSLAQRCRPLLEQSQAYAANFRVRRNKKLAHFDLATALRTAATPMPGVTRKSIEDTLQAVRSYMNAIESHYDDRETGYEHAMIHQGASALIARLQDSRRYDEHVRSGRLPIDDRRLGRRADL